MKDYPVENIRNIAIVGHGSSGKTSLASAMLFDVGATTRFTKVDKGNTITDYDPDEIERKISISSALCHCEWKDFKLNIVDCPGYSNFLWDTRAALRAVDAGLLVVCSVSGVEVGTEKAWAMFEEFELPYMFVINKLDRENSSFERTVASIQEFFGRQAVPVQIPIGSETSFRGVVDLIHNKAYEFEKDERIYSRNEFYPQDLVQLFEITKYRGTSLAEIWLNPVQYNPVKKQVKVYTKIKVDVNLSGITYRKGLKNNSGKPHWKW